MKKEIKVELLDWNDVQDGKEYNAYVCLQSKAGVRIGGCCMVPEDLKIGDIIFCRVFSERSNFEPCEVVGLNWKVEPQLPDLKLEADLSTITFSTVYNGERFYVDIVKSANLYEAYLYSEFCSYKKYIFGMSKNQMGIDCFIDTVGKNLYEHIDFYVQFEDNLDEFLDKLVDEEE